MSSISVSSSHVEAVELESRDDADKKAKKLFRRKKGRSRSYKTRRKLNHFLNHIATIVFLAIASFFLVFIDDIVEASGAPQTFALVTGIGTVQVVIFFVFLVELLANIYVYRKEYIKSPLIILDLLALISLIPDLLVFVFQVEGVASLQALGITRVARAARVATRLSRVTKILAVLFVPRKGEEEQASTAIQPSKVGKKLVNKLVITVICMMMILLLAASLCTIGFDPAPHAQVALSVLHAVANNTGLYSAEFNNTLDAYVLAYSNIHVVQLKIIGETIINKESERESLQPAYLVEYSASVGGSASSVMLSEKKAQEYIAGLSITLSVVLIILLVVGALLVFSYTRTMVIQPLEKMLALIKKITHIHSTHTHSTFNDEDYDDDDDDEDDNDGDSNDAYDTESGDGYTDTELDSDSDPDLETDVLVSVLNKLTQEHEEEEQKKRVQFEIARTVAVIQCGCKGWLSRKRFSEIKKYTKRTQLIAAEMLSTEKSYIVGLQICVQQYLTPLRNSLLIPPEKLSIIFSNIEQIYEFNKAFLAKLDERISVWTANQIIGDIFIQLSKEILDVYSGFVNNYNDAIESIKSYKTEEKFAKFLEERMLLPENNLDIQSYLIMPVQRIPRYVMLLEQLLKFTPSYHRDYAAVDEAYKAMKQVTVAMNERKRDAENQLTVQELVMRMDTPVEMLLEAKVALVKSATFKMEGDTYTCLLFSNSFVQVKEKGESLAVKSALPLSSLKVTSVCDSPHFGLFNALLIEGGDTSMLLTSKTPEQKKEWLEAFVSQLVVLKFMAKARAGSQLRASTRNIERRESSAASLKMSPLK